MQLLGLAIILTRLKPSIMMGIPHIVEGRELVAQAMTRPPSLDDWLTTDEVAEYFDVPARIVLRMIRDDRITAEKKGWMWLVHRSNLPASWPPPLHVAAN